MSNPYDLNQLVGKFRISELVFFQKIANKVIIIADFEKAMIIDLIDNSKHFDFELGQNGLEIYSLEILEILKTLEKFKKLKIEQKKTLVEYLTDSSTRDLTILIEDQGLRT